MDIHGQVLHHDTVHALGVLVVEFGSLEDSIRDTILFLAHTEQEVTMAAVARIITNYCSGVHFSYTRIRCAGVLMRRRSTSCC